ncbi:MAG: hypothetical protein ACREQ5_22640, partial [Candidatus Dormibacteria bacterium]
PCDDRSETLLPPGKDLEPPAERGAARHDHSHVSGIPFRPTVQVDHGKSKDGFSEGPYPRSDDDKSESFTDDPTVAAAVYDQAVRQVLATWGKEQRIGDKTCTLTGVKVVQRFVTVVYLGGKPARTIHWTATYESSLGQPIDPGGVRTTIVGEFSGGIDPNKVIRDWRNGRDPTAIEDD